MPSSKNKKTEDNPQQQSFDIDSALSKAPNEETPEPPKQQTTDKQTIAPDSSNISEEAPKSRDPESSEIDIVDFSEDIDTNEDSPYEALSGKETKEIVTPYAFTVSPELLGQRLASPKRRGAAILIDLFLISVLSSLSALFFASFLALTFFRAGKRLKQKKRFNLTRLGLRACTACLVFFVAFNVIDSLDGNDDDHVKISVNTKDNRVDMDSLMDLAVQMIDVPCSDETFSENTEDTCLLEYAGNLAVKAAAMGVPIADIQTTALDLVQQKTWPEEKKALFISEFNATLEKEQDIYKEDSLEIKQNNVTVDSEPSAPKKETEYSIIGWIQGLMSELGLGLGWAALYFSVFTAWWRGQTIGKRLLGIEVVRLDGNYPNLWESFGRYGGYGAGLATGLLGFLQIFWDPNRQAIQDKISETLVLRLGRNK